MAAGQVFYKYGRKRKNVPTLLWITDDMQQIHWRDAYKDRGGDFAMAIDLQEILLGFSTPTFRKYKAGTAHHIRVTLERWTLTPSLIDFSLGYGFSLVLPSRTVDLVCESLEIRNAWCASLTQLREVVQRMERPTTTLLASAVWEKRL